MFELFMFFVWVGVSMAVSNAACYRFNRSMFGWFVLSLLVSPIISGFLLLVVGPRSRKSYIDWRRMSQPLPVEEFLQQADEHPANDWASRLGRWLNGH